MAPSDESLYIVAEKILGHGELLPEDWPIAGTTGYGFLNAVNGLFVDSANEHAVRELYAVVTGRSESFADVAYHSKRLVMGSSMASELAVLARALKAIAGERSAHPRLHAHRSSQDDCRSRRLPAGLSHLRARLRVSPGRIASASTWRSIGRAAAIR